MSTLLSLKSTGSNENSETHFIISGSDVASKEQLANLSHELDCMGLPTININVDVLEQLIGSIYKLMSLYKQNLAQQKQLNLQNTILENEKASQQRIIESYNSRLNIKENHVQGLRETIRKRKIEMDDLKSKYHSVNKDFDALRHLYHAKEDENTHNVIKLKLENQTLKERLGEDVGKFKSQDLLIVEALNKYKIKEGIYEDTIKRQQENNEHLLNEILILKEEVSNVLQSQSDDY